MTQEVLKLALEAMESVTVECNNFHHPKKDQNHHWAKCPPVGRWDKAITAIKEALREHAMREVQRLGQEPVKYSDYEPDGVHHTTPPQRKPLTDEEIAKELYKFEAAGAWYQFARAIEAAHGIREKNNVAQKTNS